MTRADIARAYGATRAALDPREQEADVFRRVTGGLRAASAQGEMVRRLRALFEQAGVLVIRGMHSDCPLDPVAHVIAGDITELPKDGGLYGVHNTWELVVDQVRPTSMKIVVPWFTYDQVKALWDAWTPAATYAQVIAARPGDTYLDWQRDMGWGPTREEHLLKPGELAQLIAPLEVLHGREVFEPIDATKVRAVASVVAQKR